MTLAHVEPSELWTSWSLEPAVLAGLALVGAAYARGLRRGVGTARIRRRHVWAFAGGLAALALALVSPLDALSSTLLTAHMVQHLVLMMVAAPLLVAGRPARPLLGALPPTWRVAAFRRARTPVVRKATALVTHPVVVGSVGAAVLWVWHAPVLYQRALSNDALHALEHVSFLAAAVLLWALVIGSGRRGRAGRPIAAAVVFATALQSAALGAVVAFAGTPLYPAAYGDGTEAWGLAVLEDQQLGGAVMWVPPGLVYFAVMWGLLWRWLTELDTSAVHDATVATAVAGRRP